MYGRELEIFKGWMEKGFDVVQYTRPEMRKGSSRTTSRCHFSPAMLSGKVQKTKWKSKMPLAIRRRPPPSMVQISRYFYTPLFSFAIESHIYETDFTVGVSQKYHF